MITKPSTAPFDVVEAEIWSLFACGLIVSSFLNGKWASAWLRRRDEKLKKKLISLGLKFTMIC
jgi:hypothetical protein